MRFKSKATSTAKFLSSGDISAIYIVYLAQMILGVALLCQGYGVVPRRRPPRDFAALVGLQEVFNPDGIVRK